jgi:hypothetical protein
MNPRALIVLLTVACVTMVLSHESLLVYLPYLFAGLVVRLNEMKKAVQTALIPASAAGVAAVAVVLHPGNREIASQVCTSIGGQLGTFGVFDGTPCSGSIAWLQLTLSEAHTVTWQYVTSLDYYRVFSVLALLSLAPIFLLLYRIYARSTERLAFGAIVGSALVSMFGTVALCYGAIDWGRWIHFHALCLMLLLLPLFNEQEVRETKPVALPMKRRILAATMILAYATVWQLPVTRTSDVSTFRGVWQRLGEKMTGQPDSTEDTTQVKGRAAGSTP